MSSLLAKGELENPVERPEEYRWCSIAYHLQTGNRDNFLSMDFGLSHLGYRDISKTLLFDSSKLILRSGFSLLELFGEEDVRLSFPFLDRCVGFLWSVCGWLHECWGYPYTGLVCFYSFGVSRLDKKKNNSEVIMLIVLSVSFLAIKAQLPKIFIRFSVFDKSVPGPLRYLCIANSNT